MPALQVRDFPDGLYEQLRAYAATHHRSIAQQTIIAVEQMIQGKEPKDAVADSIDDNQTIYDFETEKKRKVLKAKRQALFDQIDRINEASPVQNLSKEEEERLWRSSRYELEHRHDVLLPDLNRAEKASC